MEDFYDDVLNRINKTIYEQHKPYGPKDFFSQVFKIDIKIDYPNDTLKRLELDISTFISVFHFFWEENDVIFDNRGEGYFHKNNLYNSLGLNSIWQSPKSNKKDHKRQISKSEKNKVWESGVEDKMY